MHSVDRRLFLRMLAGSAASVGLLPALWADDPVLDRGFTVAVRPYTTGRRSLASCTSGKWKSR